MPARLVAAVMMVVCVAAPANADPKAEDILAKSAAKYRAAKSYWDHGTATVEFSGRHSMIDRLTFDTAFVRPDKFRFEYREDSRKTDYVIWTEQGLAKSQWTSEPGVIRDDRELELALARATGVSHETAHLVPSLLEVTRRSMSLLSDPRIDGTEILDGHRTWRIVGQHFGEDATVWIDRDSFALRKLRSIRHFPAHDGQAAFDTEKIITYAPHLDEPVRDAQLAAPAPVARPSWLGANVTNGTKRVIRVLAGSPAEQAGIRPGDAIVSFGGHWDGSTQALVERIAATPPGKIVKVVVWRDQADVELTVTLALRPTREEMENMLVGKPAPPLDLPAVGSNERVRSRDLAGHVVIVEFWATWCGPCAMVRPKLDALQAKYGQRGVRVIGISNEPADTLERFSAKKPAGYTLVRDANDSVYGAFGVEGIPRIFVIDATGVVRQSGSGVALMDQLDGIVGQLVQ